MLIKNIMAITTDKDLQVIEQHIGGYDLHIFYSKEEMVQWLQLPRNKGRIMRPCTSARGSLRYTDDHRFEVFI